ncbi:MAG: CYTH domain-containing protein [Magnetococcales bacterium]|nr:CYTH domain-containing protein [Magnetococcales bacterium]
MHLEEEIKLTAPDLATLDALLQNPRIRHAAGSRPVHDRSFLATYYDTPEKDLLRHKFGLRIRQAADQWWISLKGDGTLVGGVARHTEWDALSSGPVACCDDLPPGPLRDRVWAMTTPNNRLTPLLITDIQRRTLELELAPGCRVEMAMDAGTIQAGNRKIALFEVELESLTGPFTPVHDLAAELRRQYPLSPATLTKFQQGLVLLSPLFSPIRSTLEM